MDCTFQFDTDGKRLICPTCLVPHPLFPAPEMLRRNCGPQVYVPPPIDYTPAELPCQYRLALLDNKGTCDQCGPLKGSPFEQYGCFIHGTCSLAQRHSGVKACCRCNDSPQKPEWPEHLR